MPAFRPRRSRSAPPPADTRSGGGPYEAGLAHLARREWSVARLRARLLEDGHAQDAVEHAIERLASAGALDDRRMALAHVRTASRVKGRGRYRILRELANLGVDEETARRALDDALPAEDDAARLERAIDRRVRGPMDDRGIRRAYASLVRLGFPPGEVAAALRRRRYEPPDPAAGD